MIRKLLQKLLSDEFTKNNEKYAKINFGIILVMFIISAIMLLFLPKEIPIIHEGPKTYNIPSVIGVWLFPMIGLIVNFSFIKQKRLSVANSFMFLILGLIMIIFYLKIIL